MTYASDPGTNAAAIVADSAIASCRGIYVGTGGDISIDLAGSGSAIIFKGAVAGTILPVAAKRVNSSGTTASNLVALW